MAQELYTIQSDELLPSEATVLEALGGVDTQLTQRRIASQTGYSIGLVNATLKKLTQTGYIKMVNLNKRQIQYLLTPQGMATISRRACSYVMRTVRDYRHLQNQIATFFQLLCEQGHCKVRVEGDAELKELVHWVVRDSTLSSQLVFSADDDSLLVNLNGITTTANGPMVNLAVSGQNVSSQTVSGRPS